MTASLTTQPLAKSPIAALGLVAPGSLDVGRAELFTAGSYPAWAPPKSGFWKFVAWGAGGGSTSAAAGASGAYVEKTVLLIVTNRIAIVVGVGSSGNASTATTIALPGVIDVTAGAGEQGNNPGLASGGDVNLNGSNPPSAGSGTGGGAAGASGGGAGAPANLPFRGGAGTNGENDGHTPGGGGTTNALSSRGGDGLVIAYFVKNP